MTDVKPLEKYEDPNKYDKLMEQIVQLDKDIEALVKLISLRGDGYHIPHEIFYRYNDAVNILHQIAALNIKKSKYEDTVECHGMLEQLYIDLAEIEKQQ